VGYTAVNILPALAELAQLTSLMLKANADVMVLGPGTLAGVSKVLSLDIRELHQRRLPAGHRRAGRAVLPVAARPAVEGERRPAGHAVMLGQL